MCYNYYGDGMKKILKGVIIFIIVIIVIAGCASFFSKEKEWDTHYDLPMEEYIKYYMKENYEEVELIPISNHKEYDCAADIDGCVGQTKSYHRVFVYKGKGAEKTYEIRYSKQAKEKSIPSVQVNDWVD